MNKVFLNIQRDGSDTIADKGLAPEDRKVERTMPTHAFGRDNMRAWVRLREENVYSRNKNFAHTLAYHLGDRFADVDRDARAYGAIVPCELDRAVTENDYRANNPRIDPYNYIGDRVDRIVHHPDYAVAGDYIYGTGLVKKLATLGGLREGMAFYFLSGHVGEAGHMCPVICGYETARVLRQVEDFPGREEYIAKLEHPNYSDNYTSSQFLTEIQGGSDVGANDTRAWQDDNGNWFIRGEKWFCSNADAELMVISARRSMERTGTRGLSMFLIPSVKPDGTRNDFTMRRLKEKMGTRALASAEIDYHDAYAIPLGDDFKFMLEKVIHHSRISLAVAVLGFNTRAYQLALDFSRTRQAFGTNILQYPLVRENLAAIKADMTASLAGTYALVALQDQLDTMVEQDADQVAFCRLMVNIGKSVISKRTVDNIHHCIDAIGGNGAIENTSSLPRLFRDTVIFENWEGTHNTLYMQILRDIQRYGHDQAYVAIVRSMIEALPVTVDAERAQAHACLKDIEQLLEEFHAATPDLQTLIVRDIVVKMADLYYFVCLCAEGADQAAAHGDDNKLKCAALFHRERLSAGRNVPDAAYVALCSDILAPDL